MPAKVCTHPWEFRVEPFRVYGNLYFVGNKSVCSWLIDSGDGLILIDTTFPQTAYLVIDGIWRLGFRPQDVRYLLHTHAHYDHIGGTRAIRDLVPADICVGAADIPVCEGRPELTEADLYEQTFTGFFKVDRALHDGDTITLGETSVLCVHTPGHTAGTMSYFFDIAGDRGRQRVGMQGGPGLAPLMDDYLAAFELPRSLRADYLASVERLRRERVDIHLTGHPAQSQILQRRAKLAADPLAFVDPGRWGAYLDQLERHFRKHFGEPG